MENDAVDLLVQARRRAAKLLEELESRNAEIEENPPALAPNQLEAGRTAMHNALAAARRTLAALDEALTLAPQVSFDDDENES
jgi:hypothetical protein